MQNSNSTNDNSNSANSNDGTNTKDGSSANANAGTGANSNNNNPTSNPNVSSRSAGVGTNGPIATVAPSEDAVADGPSEDAAYEVSKTPSTKSTDPNALAYAVVGVLAIGALLGLGYVKRNRKE